MGALVDKPGHSGEPVGYDLPQRTAPAGPVVAGLLRRTALVGGAGAALALLAGRRASSPGSKAAALGALAPGAGYVYTRNPVRAAATGVGFAGSLFAWFGTGNILAPPAVWAASALDARRIANTGRRPWRGATTVVPALLAAGAVAGSVARTRAFRASQVRGRERAEYLKATPRLNPVPPAPQELSEEDLAAQRGFLDRALQPVDRFDGFDWVEQFQTAAVRYQLFMMGWALNLAELHHTPAFQGYVAAAQRNLIEKTLRPEVLSYWRWEQAWGNLSLDADPIVKDNIMLSGYIGVVLGAYESTTGDDRYRRPGSLPFQVGRRTFPYNVDEIAAAVHANMRRSRMTLFPCEPNWVYSGCNMTGMNTLLLADRLHGTSHAADVDELFRRRLNEEFVTADGRITAIRSARLGLTIPMLTSTLADSGAATMAHAADPDLARRTWAIVRREFVDVSDPENPTITLRGWDAIDTGNYRKSDAAAFSAVMWAAAEMGDRELYDILKKAFDGRADPVVENGARWYRGVSVQANDLAGMARFSPPGGYRAMVLDGPGEAVLSGPYLEGASYPAVLVAHAVTDGADLRLVLRPGDGGGRQPLGIERLRPGVTYTVKGGVEPEVVADARGHATVEVDLHGRTELVIAPAG